MKLNHEDILLATDIMWTTCGQTKTYLFHPRGEISGTHPNTDNVKRYLDYLENNKVMGNTMEAAVISFIYEEFGTNLEIPTTLDKSYREVWMQDDAWYDWLDEEGVYVGYNIRYI